MALLLACWLGEENALVGFLLELVHSVHGSQILPHTAHRDTPLDVAIESEANLIV